MTTTLAESIPAAWRQALLDRLDAELLSSLSAAVEDAYAAGPVCPPHERVFAALEACAPADVRVVIIGQDPYHGEGQANGLAFSVNPDVRVPPSLANIYKELAQDVGCNIPNNGDLTCWARQGVLLLNTVLTVREHEPMSHQGLGWEELTAAVLDVVEAQPGPVVYLLWGGKAKALARRVKAANHLALTAPHPSPLSAYRGFLGCGHFSACNEFLAAHGAEPIDWQVPNV